LIVFTIIYYIAFFHIDSEFRNLLFTFEKRFSEAVFFLSISSKRQPAS
jgi:hypothetical protein